MDEVAAVTDEYDIPLVVDEIQSGVGRTGEMWAADHYAIEPDVIASAKALRVGATISRSEMFPTEKNRLGSTFGGGDLLGSMMGAFTLQAIDEYDLLANATRRGRQAKEILRDDTPDTVVDVRGKGLMLAVEFDTPERRSAVVEASLDRGLLTLGCGTKTIRLLPRSTRPNAKSRSARAFSSTRSTPSVRARRPPDAVVEVSPVGTGSPSRPRLAGRDVAVRGPESFRRARPRRAGCSARPRRTSACGDSSGGRYRR